MKRTIGLACMAVALACVFMCAGGAFAADVTFRNELDIRLSVTMTYVDKDSGQLTTKGWWYVEPGGSTVITVDSEEAGDIYYAAYNKDQFIDSSTLKGPKILRWASPRMFSYTDEIPSDEGIWEGKFYKVPGPNVNIDSRPHGG